MTSGIPLLSLTNQGIADKLQQCLIDIKDWQVYNVLLWKEDKMQLFVPQHQTSAALQSF